MGVSVGGRGVAVFVGRAVWVGGGGEVEVGEAAVFKPHAVDMSTSEIMV